MVNEENDCHSHIFEPLFSKTIMLKMTVDIFTDRSKGVLLLWIIYFCLVLLCFHARLFADALWSPAG